MIWIPFYLPSSLLVCLSLYLLFSLFLKHARTVFLNLASIFLNLPQIHQAHELITLSIFLDVQEQWVPTGVYIDRLHSLYIVPSTANQNLMLSSWIVAFNTTCFSFNKSSWSSNTCFLYSCKLYNHSLEVLFKSLKNCTQKVFQTHANDHLYTWPQMRSTKIFLHQLDKSLS